MKGKIAIIAALAALTFSASVAEARYRGDRGFRHRRVIVEQPAPALGIGIAGLLLLGQLGQQQPQFQTEERLQPLPREPKLRRESPIPLK